jgi:hypothetical protein
VVDPGTFLLIVQRQATRARMNRRAAFGGDRGSHCALLAARAAARASRARRFPASVLNRATFLLILQSGPAARAREFRASRLTGGDSQMTALQ